MTRTLLLFCSLLATVLCSARQVDELPRKMIQAGLGYSKHGTGDMGGARMEARYQRYIKDRYLITGGMAATVHSGSFPLYYTGPGNSNVDASYRYSTGGLQLFAQAGWLPMRATDKELGFRIGPLLRYQVSSYYDEMAILYPAATNLPVPVMTIVNRTPQNTFTVGAMADAYYQQRVGQKLFTGVRGGLQTDSNGDLIWDAGLTIGWRLE